VVVINADKIRLTGKKLDEKEYQRYSMYPGGQTREVARNLLGRKPEAVVELAVRGMLPKNPVCSTTCMLWQVRHTSTTHRSPVSST